MAILRTLVAAIPRFPHTSLMYTDHDFEQQLEGLPIGEMSNNIGNCMVRTFDTTGTLDYACLFQCKTSPVIIFVPKVPHEKRQSTMLADWQIHCTNSWKTCSPAAAQYWAESLMQQRYMNCLVTVLNLDQSIKPYEDQHAWEGLKFLVTNSFPNWFRGGVGKIEHYREVLIILAPIEQKHETPSDLVYLTKELLSGSLKWRMPLIVSFTGAQYGAGRNGHVVATGGVICWYCGQENRKIEFSCPLDDGHG